ncbi:MAG: YceH family protein [Mariprofundaceae bacterium]
MMDEAVKGMLSAEEARVLGSLMEKQMTTPDYYPLTLKALTAACNQKSSRVPVMSLSEGEVAGVVSGLRSRGLVTARLDGRVDRYEQQFSRKLSLSGKERAVVCVLLLRAVLTLNEIRIHTGRMVSFDADGELADVLQQLMQRDDPLLVRIPRASGQREDRYAHLLCGEPDVEIPSATRAGVRNKDTGGLHAGRLDALEAQIAELRDEVRLLKDALSAGDD